MMYPEEDKNRTKVLISVLIKPIDLKEEKPADWNGDEHHAI